MHKKKSRIVGSLAIVISVAALIFACGKEETVTETEEETETETQVAEIVETETEEPTEVVDPHEGEVRSGFTGLWVSEEVASQRPVALMVENTKATLPQYGLSEADIIYEEDIEGTITRFMCVFQDYKDIEKVGNFRSCRPGFIPLARENGAVYIHCGGSEEGLAILKTGVIDRINLQKDGYQFTVEDTSRKAPHHLYMTGETLTDAFEYYEYDTQISEDYTQRFQFVEDGELADLSSGDDCYAVAPYFWESTPYFIYDENDGLYYRYEYDQTQIDGNTGRQLSFTNIIIQNCVSYTDSDGYYQYYEFTAGGDGWYVSNGKVIPITWTKASDAAVPVYYDENGNELQLNSGKTYIAISQNRYKDHNKFYATKEEFDDR